MSGALARRDELTQGEIVDAEFSDTTRLSIVHSAEIRTAIEMARKHRRSVAQFITECEAMAIVTPAVAKQMFYAKRQGKDFIYGPSIRLAEIASSIWGNLRVASTDLEDTGHSVKAQGMAHDLQSNTIFIEAVEKSILTKDGNRYPDHMVIQTFAAARATAQRNAIFKLIPKAFLEPIWRKAKEVAAGDAKSFAQTRADCMAYFEDKFGIKTDRVYATLEIKGEADITAEHISALRGMVEGLKSGDIEIGEIFPEIPASGRFPAQKPVTSAGVAGVKEKLGSGPVDASKLEGKV